MGVRPDQHHISTQLEGQGGEAHAWCAAQWWGSASRVQAGILHLYNLRGLGWLPVNFWAPVARRGRSKAGGTEAAGVINCIYLRYENGEICSEAFGSYSGIGFSVVKSARFFCKAVHCEPQLLLYGHYWQLLLFFLLRSLLYMFQHFRSGGLKMKWVISCSSPNRLGKLDPHPDPFLARRTLFRY